MRTPRGRLRTANARGREAPRCAEHTLVAGRPEVRCCDPRGPAGGNHDRASGHHLRVVRERGHERVQRASDRPALALAPVGGRTASWPSESPCLVRPVLQRLGQRAHADVLFFCKVRDRARDAQGTVHGAGRHAAAVHGVCDEPVAGRVQHAALLEPRGRKCRVQAAARALVLAGGEYASSHGGTRLTRSCRLQLARGQRRHLDLQVEPVQYRSAHSRMMLCDLRRRAATAPSRMP